MSGDRPGAITRRGEFVAHDGSLTVRGEYGRPFADPGGERVIFRVTLPDGRKGSAIVRNRHMVTLRIRERAK
jgi:hypothetical protein